MANLNVETWSFATEASVTSVRRVNEHDTKRYTAAFVWPNKSGFYRFRLWTEEMEEGPLPHRQIDRVNTRKQGVDIG